MDGSYQTNIYAYLFSTLFLACSHNTSIYNNIKFKYESIIIENKNRKKN